MSHFNLTPYDDFFSSICIHPPLPANPVSLVSCSRAISFSGNKAFTILTIFGSIDLFAAQAGMNHKAADGDLKLVMRLTPGEYKVYPYYCSNLPLKEIAGNTNLGYNTVKSYTQAIRDKSNLP